MWYTFFYLGDGVLFSVGSSESYFPLKFIHDLLFPCRDYPATCFVIIIQRSSEA